MERLYGHYDNLVAGYIKSALEAEGIDCVLRNEYLVGGAGELPPTACWPEIWVMDPRDLPRAREVLEAILARDTGPVWTCGTCGERHDAQFSACWRCGAERPRPP